MAKAQHTIRIISGTHRSRRLPVLDFEGLRPTGDRVRETLFNWLQMHIAGKNILDLCAGAGSLGFEAASRGAKLVVMVENHRKVAQQLAEIKSSFAFKNVSIKQETAQNYLQHKQPQFDLVFLDPPFSANIMKQLTELVLTHIKVNGFLYREAGKNQELTILSDNWKLYRQKTLGQVRIELWQKIA
jgi:16S rRNA (guanine966-N2)-methyltransferase